MLDSAPIGPTSTRLPEGTGSRRRRDAARRGEATTPDSATVASVIELYQRHEQQVPSPRHRSERANRALNVALALISIVLLAPVFALVALIVFVSSRGPVIYVQERVGIDRRSRRTLAMYDRRASDVGGSVFTIYKFRTMRVDAEAKSGAVWATQHDPRVTSVGRILRRTRLDELPQLFNVLRGDMNIVGPRPERPAIFQDLRQNIAEYALRQRAKPGITGLAQINHNYDSCLDDVRTKVSYDLQYLSQQSLWSDVKIMLKTIPVMIFKKGGW